MFLLGTKGHHPVQFRRRQCSRRRTPRLRSRVAREDNETRKTRTAASVSFSRWLGEGGSLPRYTRGTHGNSGGPSPTSPVAQPLKGVTYGDSRVDRVRPDRRYSG